MRVVSPVFGWGGLNTKADATGLPLLECLALEDLRVVGRDLKQRLGISHVAQASGILKSMDFDGTNQHCSAAIDTRVWALGTTFTIEACMAADTLGTGEAVLTAGHTTDSVLIDIDASSKWQVTLTDSGDAETTLTSTTSASTTATDTLQVTRNGAAVALRLNNVEEDTDTMSATNSLKTPVGDLRVARSAAAAYFDGSIDYIRVYSYVKSNHADRLVRCPNPRARGVLADYDFNESAGGLVYDRSRYENHLITQNSPTEGTSLCHNPAPIRALSQFVDKNGRKQLLVVSGGQYYLASMN